MKFWDSSAIIPLCLKEPTSERIRDVLKVDEDIVVWWATRVECLSALERRRREGALKIPHISRPNSHLRSHSFTCQMLQI